MSSTLVAKAAKRRAKPRQATQAPVDIEAFTVNRDDGGRALCFLVRHADTRSSITGDVWDEPFAMWGVDVAITAADGARRLPGHVVIQDQWQPSVTLAVPYVAGGAAIQDVVAAFLIDYYRGVSLAA